MLCHQRLNIHSTQLNEKKDQNADKVTYYYNMCYQSEIQYNTSEQTVLLPKYRCSSTLTKKYILILSLSEDV